MYFSRLYLSAFCPEQQQRLFHMYHLFYLPFLVSSIVFTIFTLFPLFQRAVRSLFEYDELHMVIMLVDRKRERWTKRERHKCVVVRFDVISSPDRFPVGVSSDVHKDSLCLKLNLNQIIKP